MMPIDPDPRELLAALDELNRGLAGPTKDLQSFLASPEGLDALARIWAPLNSGLMGDPDHEHGLDALRSGANAFTKLLDTSPSIPGGLETLISLPVSPGPRGDTPRTARDRGLILGLGSMYLGLAGRLERRDHERLWEIIAGADDLDGLLRDALAGRPFEPPLPAIPDNLGRFARDDCFAGVLSAQLGFAIAWQAWAPSSDAHGIRSLDPPTGCAGDTVVIRGRGFGRRQPDGDQVLFPDRFGSCTPARVVPGGWSPTAIEIEVPEDVGTGCAGFSHSAGGAGETLAEAASTLVGEVGSCLGPLAGEPIDEVYRSLLDGAARVSCPPCLPNGANRFVGGPPVIAGFEVDRHRDQMSDVSTVAELASDDIVELRWRVENATAVEILPVRLGGQLNELPPLAGPFDPAAGSFIVMWSGTARAVASFTWIGGYELRATNACGTTTAMVTLRMRAEPLKRAVQGYWGVADAGRQVEGNNTNDDWEIFTTDPKILQRLAEFKQWNNLSINPQRAGGALDHWSLTVFIQAVERAQALGLNAYRFSIEWSRVEPTRGMFDTATIANYQAMIDAVRARGMEPFVVLSHLSLPAWVLTPPRLKVYTAAHEAGASDSDPDYQRSLRGWESSTTVDEFVSYVEYVVSTLHGVSHWITFNEPLGTTVLTGYLASVFPPGFLGDGAKALAVIQNLVTAHARAFETIKSVDSHALVGITDQWLACKPTHDANATQIFVHYNQDFLIDALVRGQATLQYPNFWTGAPEGLNFRVLGIAEADWTPHIDFFGLQYYKSVYPEHFVPLALSAPWLGGKTDLDLSAATYSHALLNDMGWEMSPEGLYESLMKLKQIAATGGREIPILVAENGTAEIVDHNRSAFITSHLEQLQRARADGANVMGYLHWSLADNWEWIDGYRKEARFGLFSVDLPPSSVPLEYAITEGALALSYVMADPGSMVPTAIQAYGRYAPDGASVEHPTKTPFATFAGTFDGNPITLLLAHPTAIPSPAPPDVRDFIGMLYYGDDRRWIRLSNIVWAPRDGILQFSHSAFAAPPQLPERIFAGQIDPATGRVAGIASVTAGNSVAERDWQVARVPLAGMWQGSMGGTSICTLMLSCPEGTWLGRWLIGNDWNPMNSLVVDPNGFSATDRSGAIAGVYQPPSLTVSPLNVGLVRLSDGVPF